mgnify:CR=1 FL=1
MSALDKDPKDARAADQNLREWRIRDQGYKLSIKLAVVITKADALKPARSHVRHGLWTLNSEGSGRAERDAAVRGWIGEGRGFRTDLVTSISTSGRHIILRGSHRENRIRRSAASANLVNDDPADPVQWLLNQGAFGDC